MLDLLLLTVATPRKVQRDGIHCHGLRYFSITLAAYVGEPVTVRYDPRDLAEIRVYHRDAFLCRAVSPDIAASPSPSRTCRPPGTSGAENYANSSPPGAAWSTCSPTPTRQPSPRRSDDTPVEDACTG